MYHALRSFSDQWRQGRTSALKANLRDLSLDGLHYIVVVGMGGSAIGGDLLRTLALDAGAAPVTVVRGYTLPSWVGKTSLVIASSYSGNTEETIAALGEAQQRGAPVACIASGGQVRDLAIADELPFIEIPGGMQPRAALGYSLTALLTLAERIGLLHLSDAAWTETQRMLDDQTRELSNLAGNHALNLADSLAGLVPLIYAGVGLLEAVALRWQTQIHENSKTMAFGNLFPELNHNEIMGWEGDERLLKNLGVVVLRDRGDHPQVRRRMDVTRGLLEGRAGFWTEIESQGDHVLTRALSLVCLGDWVSFYLAIRNGVDPTPVGLISRLKESMAT